MQDDINSLSPLTGVDSEDSKVKQEPAVTVPTAWAGPSQRTATNFTVEAELPTGESGMLEQESEILQNIFSFIF